MNKRLLGDGKKKSGQKEKNIGGGTEVKERAYAFGEF